MKLRTWKVERERHNKKRYKYYLLLCHLFLLFCGYYVYLNMKVRVLVIRVIGKSENKTSKHE